jgi:hypothetical protein
MGTFENIHLIVDGFYAKYLFDNIVPTIVKTIYSPIRRTYARYEHSKAYRCGTAVIPEGGKPNTVHGKHSVQVSHCISVACVRASAIIHNENYVAQSLELNDVRSPFALVRCRHT